MQQWNEIQIKAKKLINEGMEMLRAGVHDAELVAGTTASAARLHVDSGRNRLAQYRGLHDLGVAAYDAMARNPRGEEIPISDAMLALFERIKDLKEVTEQTEDTLSHISVTKSKGYSRAAGGRGASNKKSSRGKAAQKRHAK